jgi:hypothetical protein
MINAKNHNEFLDMRPAGGPAAGASGGDSMFCEQYGDVAVCVRSDVPKRGTVLCATKEGETAAVYMDHCGPTLPDGTDAYMFGNRMIVVTRWREMTEAERAAAANAPLNLVLSPLRLLQGALRVGDVGWGDITRELHHSMRFMNDENRNVDSLIFLFCDSLSGEVAAAREVPCPEALGAFLRRANVRSHAAAVLDFSYGAMLTAAQTDPARDFCDILYDKLLQLSEDDRRRFRLLDPDSEAVPQAIRFTVGADNSVTEISQAEE